jgi:signal transduction histidine kinase
VVQNKPKSIFCLPVLRQNDLIAILYLENSLVAGVFTPDRIEILQLIASQAAISIENARLYESLRRKERDLIELSENLRSLSSELLLTEERERRRIAVDLHDRIGHALANVKMQLGDLKEDLERPQGLEKIKRIADLVDQSIQDTQSLTFDLSPPMLYDLGLEAALEWLVDQMQEQYRISMIFEDDQQPKPLNESIRILAFQAARELLFNVVKHAHAHHAWLSIKRHEKWVHIEIRDDGVGLHASRQSRPTNRKTGGFGLFSIQERLKHFGGRLEMASEPGKGTQVTLIAPMQL